MYKISRFFLHSLNYVRECIKLKKVSPRFHWMLLNIFDSLCIFILTLDFGYHRQGKQKNSKWKWKISFKGSTMTFFLAVKYSTALCSFKTSSLGKEKMQEITTFQIRKKYFAVIFLDYLSRVSNYFKKYYHWIRSISELSNLMRHSIQFIVLKRSVIN